MGVLNFLTTFGNTDFLEDRHKSSISTLFFAISINGRAINS